MTNGRAAILLFWSSFTLAGCNDARPSLGPAAPSPISQTVPQPPTGLQPTVTAITPNIGSTAGGTWGTIIGTQLEPGLAVTLDGAAIAIAAVLRNDTIYFMSHAHAAGTVDVVVRNPGGRSSTLVGGYTFAPPDTFDFNGDWIAHAGPEYDTEMRFTIRNDTLVHLECGSSEAVTLSPPPLVHNGEFSFFGDGIAISGRLVSPGNADGTIDVAGCTNTRWWANKSDAIQTVRTR